MRFNHFVKFMTLLFAVSVMSVAQAFGQQLDYLSKAPFYKNYKKHAVQTAQIASLPIEIDKMVLEEFFYKDRVAALQPLVAVMNGYLDSLQITRLDGQVLPKKGSPYLFVGSSEAETAPPGSDMMREEYHKYAPMVIYAKKPSNDWKKQAEEMLVQHSADYMLAIWVGIVEYPKANKGVFKKKVVLGTNYESDIRFLSAEDKPVEVIQITGMLFNKKGEVLRAGAEGIIHEDTPFWAQVFDLKKDMDDKAIQALISECRREDLPGNPLAWKAAMDMLIHQLTPRAKVVG